jgi:hypothetical protein
MASALFEMDSELDGMDVIDRDADREVESEPRERRSARLANDPDKYIRPVRCGKYHARPYCPIAGERYDLGLFQTRHQARKAIEDFWWGRRKPIQRYTRQITRCSGPPRYFAFVPWKGENFQLGPFDTREEAAAAARGIMMAFFGPMFTEAAMRRK